MVELVIDIDQLADVEKPVDLAQQLTEKRAATLAGTCYVRDFFLFLFH